MAISVVLRLLLLLVSLTWAAAAAAQPIAGDPRLPFTTPRLPSAESPADESPHELRFTRQIANPRERDGASLLSDVLRDYRRFFTDAGGVGMLVAGLAASFTVRPFDSRVSTSRFNAELWEDTRLDRTFESGELVGGAIVQVGGAVATYGIGRLADNSALTRIGRDLVRAQLLTQGVTQAIKHSVRRTRPDASSRTSFPSGHASGTFASARVLHAHLGWKAGIPAYAVATYVAASRLSENKHFLSDVVFGAAIGLTAGRSVTYPRGGARFELGPLAAPAGGGIRLSVSPR